MVCMARTYRPVDREQEFLLPPSMLDWLSEDHVVWFVIEAVKRLDTSAFHRLARLGGVGRCGYDPDMMLTLFVYAMAHGVSSSRQMERLCHTDVAFRVICAQDAPDHTVLARFRQRHQDELAGLLTESLVLAAELGMVCLGTVALDGTKIAGNASKDANRGEARLRALADGYLAGLERTDQAEDAVFGEQARGDELPAQARDRTGRRERIDQALEQISRRREQATRVDRERARKAAGYERVVAEGGKRTGRYPTGTDRAGMAKIRWERAHAEAAERYQRWQRARERGEPRRRGREVVPPEQYCRVRQAWARYQGELAAAQAAVSGDGASGGGASGGGAGGKGAAGPGQSAPAGERLDRFIANMTDPDSRLLKTRNGWIQGYNCQTAASDDGFIISTRATQDANDVEQFLPTVTAIMAMASELVTRTGRDDLATVGILLADAGYDSDANLAAEGPDRLIADGKRHTLARRVTTDPATGDPPRGGTARQRMNHRLRTAKGHALYQRRSPLIEAPHAWLKDGRGLRRFTRRGLDAVDSELAFASAVTNLLKITTKGITAHALRVG